MKKYLFICISILTIILIYSLLEIYTGFYINLDLNNSEPNYMFFTDENSVYLKKSNSGEKFIIKGVELNSAYPGYEFSDYHIDENTYFNWIKQIKEMGANTIRLTNRMNPEFYSALYKFNNETIEPIYIIQSVEVLDYDGNNKESIYGFKDKLINECKVAVDVIHGNRYLVTAEVFGMGMYNKDVSKWTLGYIISGIGKEETISYTDNSDIRVSNQGYDGKYFYTIEGATETECILAEIMDEIINYETNKYGEQKIISFELDMIKDPVKYNENINAQIGKFCYINLNNIKEKNTLKTGKIVSYDLGEHIEKFSEIMSEEDKEKYNDILQNIDINSIYDGYISFIEKLYNSPVLISSYGYSTSRIKDDENEDLLTEKEQGEKIISVYNEIVSQNLCGGIISSWQDDWSHGTWNTLYATDEENEIYWLNNQSINQGFGILSFEPGEKENICYVDGNSGDWNNEELISEENGMKLYAKYDAENVYMLVETSNLEEIVYIPIDITPKSGANKYQDNKFSFNKTVDFILKIDGQTNSEVLVQEYYDSARAIYENNITGTLQYSNVPAKDTNNFVQIRALVKKKIDPNVDITHMTPKERELYRMYKVYNTGALIYGNCNPNADEYNSLADYCFGDNIIEIKIPWQLLNFSSPNEMKIHDDYYQNYGVEEIKIDELYLGIGSEISEMINLKNLKLEPWYRKVEVHERLKKSYDVIKKFWNEE